MTRKKKRSSKVPPKDWDAWNERTRKIEEYIARLEEQARARRRLREQTDQ